MSQHIPEEWNYKEGDELVLTYYRYYGSRDQEDERIYEESGMSLDGSSLDRYVNYFHGHTEVATWKGYGFKVSYPEIDEETEWYIV